MLVRHVADAVGWRAFVVERDLLAERVADASLIDRVAVQNAEVAGDHLATLVVPGAAADAITCVDRRHPVLRLLAQVGMPHDAATTRRRPELLAVRIRACEAAVVGAIALRARS